ncbi:MAG: deoxyuridine 5'-triphosphate nucleotidohydrolase [Clostridiales bacterium]|nr:deoxyuridine 5'-triphosphate nucleotidohydrolase [Clostridiales bacterium]
MRTAAKFEKVSFETFSTNGTRETYESIKLPRRATAKSAGYDFFAPTALTFQPNETVTVATGVRALMPDNWCLMIFPRSGLGFKYKLRLNNTVGIIDADYAESDNEGHIFIRMTNESDKLLEIAQGSAFAQGIFVQYMLTEDDNVTTKRNGGLGSTTKKGSSAV